MAVICRGKTANDFVLRGQSAVLYCPDGFFCIIDKRLIYLFTGGSFVKIYNTMTNKKEDFKPEKEGEVRMYVCGPTVYNYFHIGNARPFLVFDTFRNYLKYKGFKVNFVQNVTDIDDKIIKKADEEGKKWNEVAETYTGAYYEDTEKLGIEKPDTGPRATGEIEDMIKMISGLLEKGKAYVSENGVYFSVDKFGGYGKLSHRNIEELREGARVDVDEKKENPLDFALWKFSKEGEPYWESPWGRGRPGWHIECSVMSTKYLGGTFDIHGGGADLVFPHHENEIAQAESFTGRPFARYWMHNGYMNISGEKMSKSTGNIVLAREVLKKYPAEIIRMFILSAHYRSPLDFSYENMDKTKNAYREIYYTIQRLEQAGAGKKAEENRDLLQRFIEALDDDFNTPKAIAVIFDLLKEVKTAINKGEKQKLGSAREALKKMCGVLKIIPGTGPVPGEINELVKKRAKAREKKDYSAADAVKKEITGRGFVLEDSKNGTFALREMK